MRDALGEMQSVLVLAGTSDIALATVRKIVGRRGARVVLAARKPEACDAATAALRDAGASEVHSVAFDGTDFASHEGFVRATFDRYGDFDLVLVAFGVLGEGYVRLSYANSTENILRALDRMGEFLQSRQAA